MYVRPTAIGSTSTATGGGNNTSAADDDEDRQDQDEEEYIDDPNEEINKMRFNKYMSAFDIDLETLEVLFNMCRSIHMYELWEDTLTINSCFYLFIGAALEKEWC